VTHARNLLTAGFMASEYDYMLFVDADVEFEPPAVLRMLVPEKDIVVTPYRLKENPNQVRYPVEHLDPDNIKILPFDLVELKSAPAGLMLINRSVFRVLMAKYANKKLSLIKNTKIRWMLKLDIRERLISICIIFGILALRTMSGRVKI
jgi:hypothetical protein